MAKFEGNKQDVVKNIKTLKSCRAGWAIMISEASNHGLSSDAKEVLYELYEISGTIILALENRLGGSDVDKRVSHITHNKLVNFVSSEKFEKFSTLGVTGESDVITLDTRARISLMFECLDIISCTKVI